MAIGGLWVSDAHRKAICRDLNSLKSKFNLNGELKWSKVGSKKLAVYKEAVDYFWENPNLRFRTIVIPHKNTDYRQFSDGDLELGFYKFYYEMLEKWISPWEQYNILVDFKSDRKKGRLFTLEKFLSKKKRSLNIKVNSVRSEESPLSQLADLFTGAVAAAFSPEVPRGEAKRSLVDYMGSKRNYNLSKSNKTWEGRFNIFKISLR